MPDIKMKPEKEDAKASENKVEKEETIEVSKSQLTEILKRLDTVEAENKRLTSAADIGRLSQYDNKNKPKELTRVRLNVYEDPETQKRSVIMAWRMTIDEVTYDRSRGYFEKQIIELTLEDGTKVQINYTDFTLGKRRSQEQAEIVRRKRDEGSENELFEVRRMIDAKEFELDSRFIN